MNSKTTTLFRFGAPAFLSLWMLAGTASDLPAATFVNQTPISMPASGTTPYPSVINVSQLSGEITSVAVTLVNITHPNPDDLDVLLVGPQGTAVLLMSDAGGAANATNVSVIFNEASRFIIPDAGPLVAGTYSPSVYEAFDSFPNAPAPPYTSKLGAFDGKSPNGQWKLFVVDDIPIRDAGAINGGWRLVINTTNRPPVITTPLVDQVVKVGDTVTFHVGVDGTPPFGFQWVRNGVVIVPFGQGTDTLRLLNVQPGHAGLYTVFVTNGFPLPAPVGSQARLTVISPLMLEPLPELVETQPGGVVTLTAKATGTPPIRYQWRCNGLVMTNQTNSILRLTEISPFDAGSYSVVVWNDYETLPGGPTVVRVLFETGPPPQDFFQERPRYTDANGLVQSDSSEARAEREEPVAPGGGKTMWLELIARESGIMKVSTRGSAFDTFLSVFTGKDFSEMKLVTQDDDRGGCYTSELEFNAIAGEPYQIQVDGLGRTGKGGPFTLSWNLEVTRAIVPVLVSNALPQAVVTGSDAIFRVVTESTDVSYQWYFVGPPYDKPQPRALAGATEPVLKIEKAGPRDVGFYFVSIRNQFDRQLLGPWVALQIGNLPYFMPDKFETMYLTSGGTGGFLPIGFGNTVFKEVPSLANSEEGDPNPCGSPFFGTLWQGLAATNTGIIQVDTTGSDVPARLAVYQLTGGIEDFSAPAIICDLTSASNGVPAIARFDAQSGTNYAVVVEGFEASGNIQVTTVMGSAPPLTNTMKYCLVAPGGQAVLTMPAQSWTPSPLCQWRFNGVDLLNETNATLTVSGFTALNIGTYSVFISNFVSSTVRDVAYLDIAPPFELHPTWITNGLSIRYKITASNAAPFVIETTLDLGTAWTPIATNPDPCLVLLYTNNAPFSVPQRFYRAVPWAGP